MLFVGRCLRMDARTHACIRAPPLPPSTLFRSMVQQTHTHNIHTDRQTHRRVCVCVCVCSLSTAVRTRQPWLSHRFFLFPALLAPPFHSYLSLPPSTPRVHVPEHDGQRKEDRRGTPQGRQHGEPHRAGNSEVHDAV
ncbi:hypothetical protein, conserved [Leishmania donovani]|uniref:Uncharacterized protein n=1 Tax=Leishmania donovani TaxID=5661 RepID=E9BAS6_LEIDO|nr:hypothetical protein, conserved [Leishmania donovani]CBZ32351.1 hypothetical protein, conserved [Leishmania donovani]